MYLKKERGERRGDEGRMKKLVGDIFALIYWIVDRCITIIPSVKGCGLLRAHVG